MILSLANLLCSCWAILPIAVCKASSLKPNSRKPQKEQTGGLKPMPSALPKDFIKHKHKYQFHTHKGGFYIYIYLYICILVSSLWSTTSQ